MSFYPLRVLVCEGKHMSGEPVAGMLQKLGCAEVILAYSGEQALALLKEVGPVDVVLVDFYMKGMDCLDFLHAISYSGHVTSIILRAGFTPALSRAVGEIISMHGLKLLGQIDERSNIQTLTALLDTHQCPPSVLQRPVKSMELAGDQALRHALADQQFRTWFQPKFNLKTGIVYGVEALVRWHHPTRGILSPAEFLPALERLGLMDNLLFIQVQRGLELQQRARLLGHEINVAFNIEAAQLACTGFSLRLKQLLARHNKTGHGLTFELTERSTLENSVATLSNLVRLRMMGCDLAIDDFGSGFSSLQRLCELPFTEIKLDRQFTQGFLYDSYRRIAILNTLALGELLEAPVVIEGIETEEQRQALMDMGAHVGQGFLCSPPLLEGQLLEFLERGNHLQASQTLSLPG